MTKYILTFKREELQNMRNPGYCSKIHDTLKETLDKVGAKPIRPFKYAATVEYNGSIEDLATDLTNEGFGPDRIVLGPYETFKVPGPFDFW